MASNIYNAIQMPANTFFGFVSGDSYTLVVRDGINTKTHKSIGAPVELIALLELRGFRRCNFGK